MIHGGSPVTVAVMQPTNLTPRQNEVLVLLLEGQTNKEIARALAISPFTARTHVAAIMQQFGATRRQDLPALCCGTSQHGQSMADEAQTLPSMALWKRPLPALRRHWPAGIAGAAGLAVVLAFARMPDAGPASGWAAAKVMPEALVLKSVAGTTDTEIRIDTIVTPRIETRDAFLHFSRTHLATAMAQQRLGRHRFEPLRINDVDCLAYAGVSARVGDGSTANYTQAKGYLCQHPRRSDAAIRIGAIAQGRTGDFADGEAVRAVLRDLLEKTAATG